MEEAIPCCVSVRLSHSMVPEIQVSDTKGEYSQVRRREYPSNMRMEESGCDGVERPGGSRTSGGECPPEGIDIGVTGDLEGENSDQITEELSRNEEKALLGQSFLE